jgi:hypothetical protein
MRTKSGLHPYDAGLFFILRGCGKQWPLRSVEQVSGWTVTRMLAHQFDKPVREVAREIIERSQLLEDGEHGQQRQQQRDHPDAA